MSEKIVSERIAIGASSWRVWDVLTKPDYTRVYMFGCEPVTDWLVGSPLEWTAGDRVFVKGTVVTFEPSERLVYTTYSPGAFDNYEDKAENYATVTLALAASGDVVELSLTQGDFAKIANGDVRLAHSAHSWRTVLAQIKELAEQD